ncbi:hypothetical protein [Actinomadura chibensis]|uniref:Band 7 domain-containing protein n=1 Tax=Actinomadura chibensis TaxID=392828 RepID=A0A5D0NHZ3_9ACTN|nr:hypothetical protein [Actinomadura chibensis]TYB44047.1 hypothetical protein FXF69_24105 [Actinomadura chibensis]
MTYPIITQKVLSPVPRSGLLGLRSRSRDAAEIPVPTAGEVLVLRSGGRHVLDSGRLGLDDEIVVEATHVSVVDMTENKQLRVELSIPSAEGGLFAVGVEFTCRVHDPVAVVEAGLGDIRDFLAAYLRAHDDVFKAGAKYRLADFLAARTEVRAELQAYNHYVPVQLSGMTATLGNVEIPAPPEVKEYLGKAVKDDLVHQDRLAGLARSGRFDRAEAEEEAETKLRKLKLEVLGTEQEIHKLRGDRLKAEQRERDEEDALAAAHRRRDAETTFNLGQAAKVTAAVGDNPLMAHAIAAERGEISAKELAELYQQEADRLYALERLREDRAYDDTVKNAQLSRDTRVQGIIMRLDVFKEMVRKGLLDERGIKEIDSILTELVAGNAVEVPSTPEPSLKVEVADPVPDEPAPPLESAAPAAVDAGTADDGTGGAAAGGAATADDDEPYREEDL